MVSQVCLGLPRVGQMICFMHPPTSGTPNIAPFLDTNDLLDTRTRHQPLRAAALRLESVPPTTRAVIRAYPGGRKHQDEESTWLRCGV